MLRNSWFLSDFPLIVLFNTAISELEVKGILPMLKGWSLFQHLISFSMGNRFARCRPVVDDKYTQPQGLYEHIGLDTRKLKRLIIKGQLAPCFPGVEDPSADLDECPICFLVLSFSVLETFILYFVFIFLNVLSFGT